MMRLVLNCVFPCWASAVPLLLEIMPVWVLSYVFSFCQLAVFAAIISQFISAVISQPNYPTKISEEMYPLCVLSLSSGGWCLYLQPASAETGRGDPKASERECRPLGGSRQWAGCDHSVSCRICFNPQNQVGGGKPWPLQKKKSLGGVRDIVQLSVVKVIDYEQGQALLCYN